MTNADLLTVIIEVLTAGIVLAYSAGTVCFFVGAVNAKPRLKQIGAWFAIAGFALHTVDIALSVGALPPGAVQASLYPSLFAWMLLLLYFAAWWRMGVRFLGLTASPLALLLFLSSLVLPGTPLQLPPVLTSVFFSLHIGSLFLSMALLAVAFCAGVAFLYIEAQIKSKQKLKLFDKDLPPLTAFDRANHLAVVAGFPLYTVGLATGFIWARATWGRYFSADPKEIAGILIWLIFAYLFHQRVIIGWQGKKPARVAMALFALTILSMLGINLLLPTHHSFVQPS